MSSVESEFEEHLRVVEEMSRNGLGTVRVLAERLADCFARGGQLLVCGNGGSAADAQHLVGELVGRGVREPRPLPAMALVSDPATLTALSNDWGYEEVFALQVQAHGRPGDMLLVLSTSGRSRNCIRAVEAAKAGSLETVALTGTTGGDLAAAVDLWLSVPSDNTQRIQEAHGLVIHAVCRDVDNLVFEK